jgi:hypothetical protein
MQWRLGVLAMGIMSSNTVYVLMCNVVVVRYKAQFAVPTSAGRWVALLMSALRHGPPSGPLISAAAAAPVARRRVPYGVWPMALPYGPCWHCWLVAGPAGLLALLAPAGCWLLAAGCCWVLALCPPWPLRFARHLAASSTK